MKAYCFETIMKRSEQYDTRDGMRKYRRLKKRARRLARKAMLKEVGR